MPHANMEKRREYARAYERANYQRDKTKRYASAKKWRDANQDRFKAIGQRYQEAHREERRAKHREYSSRPEVKAARSARESIKRADRRAAKALLPKLAKPITFKGTDREKVWKREYQKRYRAANLEKLRAYARQPERYGPKNAARRARLRNAAGSCSQQQWAWRCALYDHRCAYCGRPLYTGSLTVDHVKPISRGGSNWPANLVPACKACNQRKRLARWTPTNFANGGTRPVITES